MKKQHYSIWVVLLPSVICVSLATGIFIGTSVYSGRFSVSDLHREGNKFKQVLRSLKEHYVDEIDLEKFTEKAILSGVDMLDPHSMYQSKEETDWSNKQLKGSFEGIGIEFDIFRDTLYVRRVISCGPSEKADLRAGDQLILVDGEPFTPKGLTHKQASERLRGITGTKVILSVRRGSNLHEISVTRSAVPLPSVGAKYMLSEQVGYVLLLRFGSHSHKELIEAIQKLSEEGTKQLVLDLRGNVGGYVRAAVRIAEEFLSPGTVIVSTRGRKRPEQMYKAKERGQYEQMPLIVLIDQQTASASEIVVSALQDNRRAVIVGSRSYGKALVQESFSLPNDSELKLTTSRYYTPEGRCIQKPYVLELKKSSQHVIERDSLSEDEVGGILPDVVVEEDTLPSWLQQLHQSGALQAYARYYYVQQAAAFSALQDLEDIKSLLQQTPLQRATLAKLCDSCTLPKETAEQNKVLTQELQAQLAYMQWGLLGHTQLMASEDLVLQTALQQWDKAQALVQKSKK